MNVDDRIALLADRVSQMEDGKEVARELYAISATISADIESLRISLYERGQVLFVKFSELNAEHISSLRKDHAKKEQEERKRIARLLASSELWTGSYSDAIALLEGHQKD